MFSFPSEYIFYLNAVLILFFVIILLIGYQRGLIRQAIGLLNTVVALVISWLFSDVFVNVFSFVGFSKTGMNALDRFVESNGNRLIWFFVLFIGVKIIFLAITPIASLISKLPLIKQVNSIAGALFSFVVYVVYLLVLIFFLTLPVVKNGQEIIDNTYLKPISEFAGPVLSLVSDKMDQNIALQTLIANRSLSIQQKQSLVNWFSSQGFTNEQIREFLDKYE